MELQYIKINHTQGKRWEKLPCKFDPENSGIGCKAPRKCKTCGWNPSVRERRNRAIQQRRKDDVHA